MNAHDEDDPIVTEAFRILRRDDSYQAGGFNDLISRTEGSGSAGAKRRTLSRRGLTLAVAGAGASSALALVALQLLVSPMDPIPDPPAASLQALVVPVPPSSHRGRALPQGALNHGLESSSSLSPADLGVSRRGEVEPPAPAPSPPALPTVVSGAVSLIAAVPAPAEVPPKSGGLSEAPDMFSKDEAAKVAFSDSFVEDLSILGRSYQNVLTLPPGVNDSNGDGNPNVHGVRERDFKATVDRVSRVDPLTGTFMSNINPDAIGDIEVVTTGASAENGGAVGGYGKIVRTQVRPRGTKARRAAGKGPTSSAEAAGADANTESYAPIEENPLLSVVQNPLSTFGIDVDTASYTNMRRYLDQGSLPPKSAVRIEELVNYFPYDYPQPQAGDAFSVSVEVADCPWNPDRRLARIGLKAADVSRKALAGSNLVFLIDVSGSMDEPAKLPLVKSALTLLVGQLDASDRVAIVVYAGASGLVLPSTRGDDKVRIMEALDRLGAGGSTNGGEGLALAYRIAREGFISGGINRVILATDGDFNVGMTDRGELLSAIKKDADAGIFLTALGFGMGNYKDDTLEMLADKGNGNYAYIDNQAEARKVLVEQVGGTLVTVAKDVKIQVEFNPARVEAYRLLGYENRLMAKEHFNDDTKDAGEIGSGHTVTALYEIVPRGAPADLPSIDPLKYQTPSALSEAARGDELLTVKLRYKDPEGTKSRLILHPVADPGAGTPPQSDELRFASAVVMFGMILRESPNCGAASLDLVEKLASQGRGRDEGGYRTDFLRLVHRAASLQRSRGKPVKAGESGR